MSDVVLEGLALLLPATLEVPGVAGVHISAMEVAGKTSHRSSQRFMVFLGRWSSQALAESAK
jgi:hypothetical protein